MAKKKLTLAYRRLLEIKRLQQDLRQVRNRERKKQNKLDRFSYIVDDFRSRLGYLSAKGVCGSDRLMGHEMQVGVPFQSVQEVKEWAMENFL